MGRNCDNREVAGTQPEASDENISELKGCKKWDGTEAFDVAFIYKNAPMKSTDVFFFLNFHCGGTLTRQETRDGFNAFVGVALGS